MKMYIKPLAQNEIESYLSLPDLTLKGKLFMHDFEKSLFFTKA